MTFRFTLYALIVSALLLTSNILANPPGDDPRGGVTSGAVMPVAFYPDDDDDDDFDWDDDDNVDIDLEIERNYSRYPIDQRSVNVDVDFFYERLAPYGEWIEHRSHGWVWSPYGISTSWRPYEAGRWVYTDYGWTWVSDEPYGWAVYHYGRWYYDPYYGWLWVPGHEWGPAWVEWRQGGGYVGWAPLPPQAEWRLQGRFGFDGISIGVSKRFSWSFVNERHFHAHDLHRHVLMPARNVNIINITNNVTNYNVINNRVVNQSIDINHIERVSGRRIQRHRIADVDQATLARRSKVISDRVVMFRPKIESRTPRRTPRDVISREVRPDQTQQWSQRVEESRRSLDTRLKSQRDWLESRQPVKPPSNLSPADASKWRSRERAAMDEQAEREKKLLERYQDRLKSGKTGLTTADRPKFRVSSRTVDRSSDKARKEQREKR